MKEISWEDLDKHFTAPKGRTIPKHDKLPRKLKKRIQKASGVYWKALGPCKCWWWYLGHVNINYKRFLVKKILIESRKK